MIAVLVPAHDEESSIAACLTSIRIAAAHPGLLAEAVLIVVALDRCTDRTGGIAAKLGARIVTVDDGNVGIARAAAATVAIAAGARWLATTDADTTVPKDWLYAQLAHGCDAFCGVVTVRDWQGHDKRVAEEFERTQCRHDDHPHVHGANLGLSTQIYMKCGGFLSLPAHEDVALVDALVAAGARIARKATPVVVTSARRSPRARGGFGDYLLAMEHQLALAASLTLLALPPPDPICNGA